MNFICLNGKIVPAGKPSLLPDNRGYRYGEGLFETMRSAGDRIPLASFHLQRLFDGIRLLGFRPSPGFSPDKILRSIRSLLRKNGCRDQARIRLSVSRGNGNLSDKDVVMQWMIECWPLSPAAVGLNTKGWSIGLFPDAQKAVDRFSSLKTSSYLGYAMAARNAQNRGLDDCLLTNSHGRIADASIANLFLVKNKLIITPSLEEGPVAGVMRRYLINNLPALNFELREGVVTKNDLDSFDEAFLSNAVLGIRWVGRFGKKRFRHDQVARIYDHLITPLFV